MNPNDLIQSELAALRRAQETARLENRDDFARMGAGLGDLTKTQIEIRADLAEHMRRTALAEESIERLRVEIKPISLHVAVVGAFGKLVILFGALIGAVAGVVKLMEHFSQ